MIITPPAVDFGAVVTLYRLTGADMNSTADQALTKLHNYSAFVIVRFNAVNASINLTTAQGGFYTGAAKSGNTLVASTQAYTSLSSSAAGFALTATATGQGRQTVDPILSLTTGQGVAATADFYIIGYGVL